MPAYDLIIRNGTIVDGTGQDRFAGDIAIKDGLIAQVGEVGGDAARAVEVCTGQADEDHTLAEEGVLALETLQLVRRVGFPCLSASSKYRRASAMLWVTPFPFS